MMSAIGNALKQELSALRTLLSDMPTPKKVSHALFITGAAIGGYEMIELTDHERWESPLGRATLIGGAAMVGGSKFVSPILIALKAQEVGSKIFYRY